MDEGSTKRDQLIRESEHYKDAIREQVEDIRNSAEQWVKTVLIIGGTIVFAYSFLRSLVNRKKGSSDNLPASTRQQDGLGIATRIMEQIAFFLMAIAREKLMEFLKTYGKNAESDTERTD